MHLQLIRCRDRIMHLAVSSRKAAGCSLSIFVCSLLVCSMALGCVNMYCAYLKFMNMSLQDLQRGEGHQCCC